MIFLHGLSGCWQNWLENLPHFAARGHRVIAVDLPGFGESGKPPLDPGYRIADQVRYVAEIANVLKLDRFDLGGNSMGGWISAAYAVAHPEQVKSLWLLDPGGVMSAADSEMITMIKAGQPVPLFARTTEDFGRLLRFVMSKPPFVPAPVMAVLASRQARNYELNLSIFKQLREDSPALDAELAALPAPLATPTLITWGDRDRVLHYSGAEVLHKLLPNSTVSIMPGIGHLPMLEAPGAAAKAYLAFRDGLPAAR
ncbi:MAG: alpha/beta fold hydrolase [Nevskia sp.]